MKGKGVSEAFNSIEYLRFAFWIKTCELDGLQCNRISCLLNSNAFSCVLWGLETLPTSSQ